MSNTNLTKIRGMMSSIKKSLGLLTVNPDELDEIDSVVSQRVMLREKLATLEAAETVERERVVKERSEAKAQQRKDVLLDIATKSEKAKNKHVELTKSVTELVSQLVSVLIEREQVFTSADTGLSDPALYELLTIDERDYLSKQLEYSVQGIYPGPFSATFRAAVDKQCADKSDKLKYDLFDLVKPPQNFHEPIKGANSKLTKAVKQMSQVAAPEPEKSKPVKAVEPKKTGSHYVADMRDNSPVIEL